MSIVIPKEAASVILVRETNKQCQALLVRKHANLSFAGGSLVFPGGKVEASDLLPSHCYLISESLTITEKDLKYITALCRETFEEIGVLLVKQFDGSPLNAPLVESLQKYRQTIDEDPHYFSTFLTQHNLKIVVSDFIYWANWITPSLIPKRFDTRFYLAPMPTDQTIQCDTAEAIEKTWVDLTLFNDDFDEALMPPTRYSLADLAESIRAEGSYSNILLTERNRKVTPVMPKMRKVDDSIFTIMPWHKDYAIIPGEGVSTKPMNPRYENYPDTLIPSFKAPGMPSSR